jgi:hypothetical protein
MSGNSVATVVWPGVQTQPSLAYIRPSSTRSPSHPTTALPNGADARAVTSPLAMSATKSSDCAVSPVAPKLTRAHATREPLGSTAMS